MSVYLEFYLTQHLRDEKLIMRIRDYLNCGKVHVYKNCETIYFRVSKFQDIVEKIIPFFQKYRIRGVKALDFAYFSKAADIGFPPVFRGVCAPGIRAGTGPPSGARGAPLR